MPDTPEDEVKPQLPEAQVLVVTPEMAWRWLTGEDRVMERRLTELALVHEEFLRDPRPLCGLCQGDGRFDDIVCLRCGGSGREGVAKHG